MIIVQQFLPRIRYYHQRAIYERNVLSFLVKISKIVSFVLLTVISSQYEVRNSAGL